jgi:ElaB/YqjD/DUF883 family membrane-anchored ribosome-binding protein
MANQNQRASQGGTRESEGLGQRTSKAASDAYSSATAMAGEAADKAKKAASSAAATVGDQVTQLLNRQVETGADTVSSVARSAKRAADELEHDAPQLSGFVRTFADRIDGYASDLHGQSAEDLMRAASDFTRRQPGLVFGLAAVAGFFAWRTLKSSSSFSSASSRSSAPPIQPMDEMSAGRKGDYHGV